MVVDKRPILNFPPRRIVTIPDTPIDLKTGTNGNLYYIFSDRLKNGEVYYTKDTHSSLKDIVKEVWNIPIIDYENTKNIPNPYKSLDEVLNNIDDRKVIAGVGRSALSYLLHEFMVSENNKEEDAYVYIATKWEKTGQQIVNPRISVVYSTIENIVKKHKAKKIIVIDDIMATGYTLRNIYSNLQKRLKDVEIYLVPVSLDISTLFISNLSNSGRRLPIEKTLSEFFTRDLRYFPYELGSREWKNIFEDFSEKIRKGYNKRNLEEISEVLSHTYPAMVINSSGGETFPATHLIRDTEEEAAKEGYSSEDIINLLMDLQARYFQNPLLDLLSLYKEKIYHAPRTI